MIPIHQPLFFDGGMGSVLFARGLQAGEQPEFLCRDNPALITSIHRAYLDAGANVVTTNTFGLNGLAHNPADVPDLCRKAVQCAALAVSDATTADSTPCNHPSQRAATDGDGGKAAALRPTALLGRTSPARAHVALDLGPLPTMLAPIGSVAFEDAVALYAEVVKAGRDGADLILIETMSDLHMAKAAILAAKEHSDLPIFCTMTFEADGRTFLGCDPQTAAVALTAFGVDAIGVNCSLGPAQIAPFVETILCSTSLPVMVQPNAGLPQTVDGETQYDISAAEFADWGRKFAAMGVKILGGCCGTTPAHIEALVTAIDNEQWTMDNVGAAFCRPPSLGNVSVSHGRQNAAPTAQQNNIYPNFQLSTVCTSGNRSVTIGGGNITIIGERLNPTGKKMLQAALRSGDMAFLAREAQSQEAAGAQILDLNVGLPGIDEPAVLVRALKAVQEVCDLPIQLDSSDPAALEAGLRAYNGKPIVNSVNGKQAVLDAILPLCKQYGALVIGLCMDERGIPATAEERLAIARKIFAEAEKHGIPRHDLIFDGLVLTAAAEQDKVLETLKTIRLIKSELGCATTLGVSNVSFGLPARPVLTAHFLAAAFGAGLDAPIVNPGCPHVATAIRCQRVLNGEDAGAERYITNYGQWTPGNQDGGGRVTTTGVGAGIARPKSPKTTQNENQWDAQCASPTIADAVLQGNRIDVSAIVRGLLETTAPLDIINRHLVPALDVVGQQYAAGTLFLPQLLRAADAASSGFEVIKAAMGDAASTQHKGTIVIATVQGDVHDIGKNIVKMLLQNYGYNVIDLGKDVPCDAIVDAIRVHNARLCGLSALMTTTMPRMKDVIDRARAENLDCKFMVGGAVLNDRHAELVGADFYAADAMAGVQIAERILGGVF